MFLMLFLLLISCERNSNSEEKKNIETQFRKAQNFLLTENYDKFCDFNHPSAIKKFGGKIKVIETLKSATDEMKKSGIKITDIKYSTPQKFVMNGNELQTSFYYDITIETPNGKMVRRNSSVAISTDKGKNWKFIDTEGKSKDIVIENFPNVSKELIIKEGGSKMIE